MKDQDYPFIRAWHRNTGAFGGYIERMVEAARAEGAPQDAIFQERPGVWAVWDDIRGDDTRERIGAPPATPERKAEFEYDLLRACLEQIDGNSLTIHDLIAVQLHRKGVTAAAFDAVYASNRKNDQVRALGHTLNAIKSRLQAIEDGEFNPKAVRLTLSVTSAAKTDGEFRA